MAGWKSGDMIGGISGIMNLAAASGEDLATTSDIVTDALTAFGMSADDSGHFADVLAAASSNANTNVSMLGESFKYVAPLCGTMGYSAEDVSIGLGLMANSGIKASQAGTSLKTALANMVSPTDAMAGVMGKYNISLENGEGGMKSFKEVMDMLRTNMRHLTDEQINNQFQKYSADIGMSRSALEALSDEEKAETIAKTVGTKVVSTWSEAQKQSALAAQFGAKEVAKMTKEQKDYQLACIAGSNELYGLSESEQAAAASTLFGKEAMAGMLNVINASDSDYQKLTDSIYNCDGTAQEMANTMNDNLQGQMTLLKSQLEGVGIQLSQTLIPMAREGLTVVSGWIDAFSKLSPETQANIVKMAAFGIATGGALKVVGGGISTIGSIAGGLSKLTGFIGKASTAAKVAGGVAEVAAGGVGTAAGTAATAVTGAGTAAAGAGISIGALGSVLLPVGVALATVAAGVYTYNEAQEAMGESCIKSREELGWFKSSLLELQGVNVQTKEELESSGLVVKEFGENIGEEFKSKIDKSTQTLNDFSLNLHEINLNDTITQSECDGVVDRVQGMVDSAVSAIDSKKEESYNSLKELFTIDGGTLDESQQQVLDYLNKTAESQKTEAETLKNEIQEINQKALDEKRTLNEEDIKSIEEKTQRIKQIELENSSRTKEELLYAQNEFAARVKSIDLQSASDLMQQKAQQRDDEIVKIRASYDTQIQLLQEKSQEATGADKEAIDQQIQNLSDARQQKIDLQNDTYDKYLQILDEKNPEIEGKIDTSNGQILTNESVKCSERLKQMTNMYSGMDEITTSGYYSLQNTTTGAMEQCYVTVDDATGRIVGCWSSASNQVGGSNSQIAESTKNAGQEVYNGCAKMQADMQMMANGSVTSSGQVVSSNGQIVGSLQDVTTNADGTKQGILNLNGTPIQVETNADGVITKCKDLSSNIEAVPVHHQTVFDFIANGWESLKSKISSLGSGVDSNWTGNESFKGGYTTLHERGYELYNLPQGTRIFNHEASEDMVMKTAESVAEKVANRVAQSMQNNNSNNSSINNQPIVVPVILDGQEIARVTAPYMSEELSFNQGRGL